MHRVMRAFGIECPEFFDNCIFVWKGYVGGALAFMAFGLWMDFASFCFGWGLTMSSVLTSFDVS